MLKNNKTQIIAAVAAINVLLAAVAFMKDMALASYLGTTEAADAFVIAFFIPDNIGNNILASAIGISCIPIFSNLYVTQRHRLLRVHFFKLDILSFMFAGGAALLIFLLDGSIFSIMGSRFSAEVEGLSLHALHIMLFTIPIYPVISIGIAMLQIKGRFIITSFAPVLYNTVFFIGIIACIFLGLPSAIGIKYISAFVLAAVIAMLMLVYAALLNNNALCKQYEENQSINELNIRSKDLMEVLGMSACYGGILLLSQTTLYFERLLALNYSTGGISSLNYAYRLAQVPIWIIASAIGTVILPMMSKASAENKSAEKILGDSIGAMLIAIIPITLALYILREPIISILFMRGAFNNESAMMTAEILKSYSLAILGQGVAALCLRYFISIRKIRMSFLIFFVSTLLNIILDYYLVKYLGLAGLGYGAAIGTIFSSLISLYYIGFKPKSYYAAIIRYAKNIIVANGTICILALFYLYIWNKYFSFSGILWMIFYTVFAALTFIVGYFYYLKHFKII